MTHVDADTVKGATFYNEMMWILPGFDKNYKVKIPILKRAYTRFW
jgi:hypothetical protein